MDLMRNIDKQKASIAAVLADVRQVAKDINLTSEASRRSFAVADEVVFQSAKKNPKDDVMTRTYKYVVNLREGFVELVAGVEAKGKAENDILSLQTQIDDIEGRNTALNLERIEGDLAQVKKESKQVNWPAAAARALLALSQRGLLPQFLLPSILGWAQLCAYCSPQSIIISIQGFLCTFHGL
jgi:hypothetical protein